MKLFHFVENSDVVSRKCGYLLLKSDILSKKMYKNGYYLLGEATNTYQIVTELCKESCKLMASLGRLKKKRNFESLTKKAEKSQDLF